LDEAFNFTRQIEPWKRKTWDIGNTPIPKAEMQNYCWRKTPMGWIWSVIDVLPNPGRMQKRHPTLNDIQSPISHRNARESAETWSNVDDSLKEFIWQCYKKGISTSMSCGGHWTSTDASNARFDKELAVSLEMVRQALFLDGEINFRSPSKDGLLGHQNRLECKRYSQIATRASAVKFTKIDILMESDREDWIEAVKAEEYLGYIALYLPRIHYCCSGPDGSHPLQSFADAASVLPYAEVILHKETGKIQRASTTDSFWNSLMKTEGGHCASAKHPYANESKRDEEWVGYYWCEIVVNAPRPKRQKATWNALAAMLDVCTFSRSIQPDRRYPTLGEFIASKRRQQGNNMATNAMIEAYIKRMYSGVDSHHAFTGLEKIIFFHQDAATHPGYQDSQFESEAQ
jgi:hypothetical protein